MPESSPVDIIKAKRDTAEAECNNLAQQVARSQQFLNETQTKLVHAQGRYAAHSEDLKELEPATTLEGTSDAPPAPAS